MSIFQDIIVPVAESTLKDLYAHRETEHPGFALDHGVRRILEVIPRWSIEDMDRAIESGDLEKAKKILETWEYLAESYANYRKEYPRPRLFMRRIDAQILAVQEVLRQVRELIFGSSINFPEDSPFYKLAKRLSDYTPGEGDPVEKTVRSLDDIVRPGQRIRISDIGESLLNSGPDADIVFFWNDDASEWRYNWDQVTRSRFPMFPSAHTNSVSDIEGNFYLGKHGFFYEYYCKDDKKTRQLLDGYLAAGFGLNKRQKIIFVQSGDYFVCLGLCTLDELDFDKPPYGNVPCCFWFYPAFSFSEGFIEEV